MPNSLYNQLNNKPQSADNNNLVNRFNEFRNSLQGDPQQMVQQLLQSGRMSQAQFNQLRQMASEFQKLLRKV